VEPGIVGGRAVSDYVIFASYGNDSVALIQWAHERGLQNVTALYNDTGWAAPWWQGRVERCEAWARTLGIATSRTISIGMEALVRRKRGWPRQGMQFCTAELKLEPSLAWLDANDPLRLATCLVGVRREESTVRRDFPEWVEASEMHGGRTLWAPMVRLTEAERNELLARAGFDPLPHRSKECDPCVNANKGDIRQLGEADLAKVERLEGELGLTAKGKPRVMFRPAKHMSAVGIREIYRWAQSDRGEYVPSGGCNSGMCGG
jgi:3'-phosphoadenosine 5'-phosphosulfate sulfotransferase (PAPS reductase)/FAD synthetase